MIRDTAAPTAPTITTATITTSKLIQYYLLCRYVPGQNITTRADVMIRSADGAPTRLKRD